MEYIEDTQYFDEVALSGVVPLNNGVNDYDYEGIESSAKGGEDPNKNSSPTGHVEIPEYQCQNMNVNQVKDNFTKRKTPGMVQKYY